MSEQQLSAIDELAHLGDRFLVWQTMTPRRGGKPTKVPFIATTRKAEAGNASSTDPGTWRSLDAALDTAAKYPKWYAGAAVALGDLNDGWYLAGVDIDSCINDDGDVVEWADKYIDLLSCTYIEVSPSLHGLKCFFFCRADDVPETLKLLGITDGRMGTKRSIDRNGADHGPGVELYFGTRFFTITQDRWPEAADHIESLNRNMLERLVDMMPKAPDGNNNSSSSKSRSADNSRSAKVFRLAHAMHKDGKTQEDWIEAMRAEPALASWLDEKGDQRQLDRTWKNATNKLPTTEDGLAMLFADLYGDRLRYCHDTHRWHEWDGDLWRPERTDLAFHWVRLVCRDAAAQHRLDKLAKVSTASGVEKFARSDRVFAVQQTVWDKDPWLLGTPHGTVDLQTGRLRAPMQVDYITKATSVPPAPTADCPLWLRFLDEVTQGDRELIRFLQQYYGYALTGVTREHAILFLYGPGGNGKSVLQETLVVIFGDYAVTAPMDTFIASRHDRHPADLAMLRGARLVAASETEQGRVWNETKLKQLTGGDSISARFMRQDFFTFRPEFKPSFIGNHKPGLRDVGTSTRRRLNMVPFMYQPKRIDPELIEKLRHEHAGILRWLIDGCLDWQRNGLVRPKAVTAATDAYFAQQDTVSRWIAEHCEVKESVAEPATTMWLNFRRYVETANEAPWIRQKFYDEMERLGYVRKKSPTGVANAEGLRDIHCYLGITLKARHW